MKGRCTKILIVENLMKDITTHILNDRHEIKLNFFLFLFLFFLLILPFFLNLFIKKPHRLFYFSKQISHHFLTHLPSLLKTKRKMELNLNGESPKSQLQFHVLAVDDNLIERKLLERLLTNSSYQVTCVESGHKALKYLGLHDDSENSHSYAAAYTSSSSPQQERLKVNLIMTDFCMPGMSGYDLLTRLKKSSWKDVPVVVMSSENVPSRINMCLEGGAEEFLLKPLQLSDLNKIQPHLLKSLHYSTTKINREFTNIAQDYKGKNNLKISNNGASKRKAVKAVSPRPSERRFKMKELVG